MKITFPHIGKACIPAGIALQEMGIPHVIPPANSIESLKLGKAVSPEEMCLPFKMMAGNLIQAYEQGAEQVIMPATMGPCRLGEYGELLKQILDTEGYKMEWILMDSPKAIGIKEWIQRLLYAGEGRKKGGFSSCRILAESAFLMWKIDEIETKLKRMAGYIQNPRDCIALMNQMQWELKKASSLKQAFSIIRSKEIKLNQFTIDPEKKPVSILVTGEIYTSIEPAANQNLEEILMRMGCSVRRPVNISWWMRHTAASVLPDMGKPQKDLLPYSIGGYAKETVEEISSAKEDGIIKIMPSGCMPEIVAKAVCSRLEETSGKRILHLVFDEMQAGAGYETRVEAFVDMLERRKHVLSGD